MKVSGQEQELAPAVPERSRVDVRKAVESCQEAFRDSVSWRFYFALQRGDLASGSRRKTSPTDP